MDFQGLLGGSRNYRAHLFEDAEELLREGAQRRRTESETKEAEEKLVHSIDSMFIFMAVLEYVVYHSKMQFPD